ncbi:MAG: hypothetical protein AB2551_09365 [Candidatus Thiodiazotropha sp.]
MAKIFLFSLLYLFIVFLGVTASYAESPIVLSPETNFFVGEVNKDGNTIVHEYSIHPDSTYLLSNDLNKFIDKLNQDSTNYTYGHKELETGDIQDLPVYLANNDSTRTIIYCNLEASFEACASLAGPALDVRNFNWSLQHFTLSFSKDGSNTLLVEDSVTGGSTVLNLETFHFPTLPTHVVQAQCLDNMGLSCNSLVLQSFVPVIATNARGEIIAVADFAVTRSLDGTLRTGFESRVCAKLRPPPGGQQWKRSCGPLIDRN